MSKIHPTAIIADGAEIGESVTIGPYCVIGPDVKIGDGSELKTHVVVDGCTTIGKACELFPFASIGQKTQDLKFEGGKTYAEIGDRTVMREYVTINTGTKDGEVTRVGSDCLLMTYCHVAHGCNVANHVIMSNGVQLAGEVTVEDHAIIAGMSACHQFVRIGTYAMVGGMTPVVQDCPPYMLTGGQPPRVHGTNSVGLRRAGFSAESRARLKAAFKLLFRSDKAMSASVASVREQLEMSPEVEHLLAFIEASQRGVITG